MYTMRRCRGHAAAWSETAWRRGRTTAAAARPQPYVYHYPEHRVRRGAGDDRLLSAAPFATAAPSSADVAATTSTTTTVSASRPTSMAPIVELCARRGFVFPGSSVYGGLASTFDYGPLGAQLKKNILDAWWRDFVELRPECVGLDTPIVLHPAVWRASGHVDEFTDPLVQCRACKHRARADKILEDVHGMAPNEVAALLAQDDGEVALGDALRRVDARCPACGSDDLATPVNFNLLFRTSLGAAGESTADDGGGGFRGGGGGGGEVVYLRPETAQGAYINFGNVISTTRRRLPIGVGQVGKAFRNEISPGKSFLFRTREFELLELQWFVRDEPAEAERWYNYWVETCLAWLSKHGVPDEMVRARTHGASEMAHYAHATTDIEFAFPGLGWGELWGIADRGTFDLEQHIAATSGGGENQSEDGQNMNKKKKKKKKKKQKVSPLTYLDPVTGERSVPRVIEPALGLTRVLLAVLSSAMKVETVTTTTTTMTPATTPVTTPAASRASGEASSAEATSRETHVDTSTRTVLQLHPRLAPIKVAVLPVVKSVAGLVAVAEDVHAALSRQFACELDVTGSIGRRYRRQDEIGTPLCVTVDSTSLEDECVTVRNRDTMRQERVPIADVVGARSLDELLARVGFRGRE